MDEKDKAYLEYLKSQGLSAEEAWKKFNGEDSSATTAEDEKAWKEYQAQNEGVGTKAKRAAATGLQGLGKFLGYLQGATVSPAIAAITETITGKDVYKPEEHLRALNPANLYSYPTPSQKLKEAGIKIPQGLELADTGLVDKESPWNIGLSDTAIDMATDPLTYLSLGLSSAAQKGTRTGAKILAEEAAKASGKKSLLNMTKEGIKKAVSAPVKIGEKTTNILGLSTPNNLTKAGEIANVLINPLEAAMLARGKKLYSQVYNPLNSKTESSIRPSDILFDLEKTGGFTDEITDTLSNVRHGAGEALGTNYGASDLLGQKYGEKVGYNKAVKKAMEIAKEGLSISNPEKRAAAIDLIERARKMRDFYKKEPKVRNIPEGKFTKIETPEDVVVEFTGIERPGELPAPSLPPGSEPLPFSKELAIPDEPIVNVIGEGTKKAKPSPSIIDAESKMVRDRVEIPIQKAWEEQRALNELGNASKFDPNVKNKFGSVGQLKMAEGLGDEISDTIKRLESKVKAKGSKADKAAMDQMSSDIKHMNQLYAGANFDVTKEAKKLASSAKGKSYNLMPSFTDIGISSLGAGISAIGGGNPIYGAALGVIPYLRRMNATPQALSRAGLNYKKMARSGVSLLPKEAVKTSPWSLVNKEEEEGE